MINMDNYIFDYDQYKKRINKPKKNGFVYIVISIILLLFVALTLKPSDITKQEFYFVETGEFITYKEAQEHASILQEKGGAGYIYYKNSYHVLAGFYIDYDSAKSVVENIQNKFENATIFTHESNKFIQKKALSSKQNNILKDTIISNENLIENLYNLIIKIDKKELNDSQIKIEIENLKNDYKIVHEKYFETFKNEKNLRITFENIDSIYSSVLDVKNLNFSTNFSSKIKNILCDIVFTHSALMNLL